MSDAADIVARINAHLPRLWRLYCEPCDSGVSGDCLPMTLQEGSELHAEAAAEITRLRAKVEALQAQLGDREAVAFERAAHDDDGAGLGERGA